MQLQNTDQKYSKITLSYFTFYCEQMLVIYKYNKTTTL